MEEEKGCGRNSYMDVSAHPCLTLSRMHAKGKSLKEEGSWTLESYNENRQLYLLHSFIITKKAIRLTF